MMGQFKNLNVITLEGVVTRSKCRINIYLCLYRFTRGKVQNLNKYSRGCEDGCENVRFVVY